MATTTPILNPINFHAPPARKAAPHAPMQKAVFPQSVTHAKKDGMLTNTKQFVSNVTLNAMDANIPLIIASIVPCLS